GGGNRPGLLADGESDGLLGEQEGLSFGVLERALGYPGGDLAHGEAEGLRSLRRRGRLQRCYQGRAEGVAVERAARGRRSDAHLAVRRLRELAVNGGLVHLGGDAGD